MSSSQNILNHSLAIINWFKNIFQEMNEILDSIIIQQQTYQEELATTQEIKDSLIQENIEKKMN